MPVAPKSPQSTAPPSATKRAGAPKAKGAVRAKSGCYTCRIRRKKCDEQPNEQGHCSTCVRLRLECLGFGAKRPDWLRENRNVLQLRDKIKNFLASQGMIKGHSGSGTRSSEQPTILRLTLNDEGSPYNSGSSSSPPSRSQTLSQDDYVPTNPRHQTSNTRGSGWAHPATLEPAAAYRHSNGHYAAANSEYHRSTSPQSLDNYPHQLSSSPHSLVQPLQSGHRHHRHQRSRQQHPGPHPYRDGYRQRQNHQVYPHHQSGWTPARASSFGLSYNLGEPEMAVMMTPSLFTEGQEYNLAATGAFNWVDNGTSAVSHADAMGAQSFPEFFDISGLNMGTPLRVNDILSFLERYKTDVVTVQYLLGSQTIRDQIANTIGATEDELTCEQEAAALLSQVHYLRFVYAPDQMVLRNATDVRLQLYKIENALNSDQVSTKPEGAMAALHLISVILFDGGHSGKWLQYLQIAATYVKNKMHGLSRFKNAIEELRRLNDKEAFIVKTAIWFDVLASVTTQEMPLLLDIIRLLFKPNQSGLAELSSAAVNAAAASGAGPSMTGIWGDNLSQSTTPEFPHATLNNGLLSEDKTSMISPMGCENKVVWALAEISALATWKRSCKERGNLSYKDLVLRSNEIEKELETKYQVTCIADDFPDVTSYSRYLASNIFRASALLYLHAVVSGGFPHVPQIFLAVEEVMRWIKRLPQKPTRAEDKEVHKTVIRSTVFSFYVAGALTDNEKHRKVITDYLVEEAGTVMGNCKVTMEILDEIWSQRRKCGAGQTCKEEVMWREILMRKHPDESILLV